MLVYNYTNKKYMKLKSKVMKTAHKIFKNSKTITWSNALKLAWKIVLNPEIKIITEYRKTLTTFVLLTENHISKNHFARILFVGNFSKVRDFEKEKQFVQETKFTKERWRRKFYLDSS
jgi:hypothetical protein